jgi:hypothetical protein
MHVYTSQIEVDLAERRKQKEVARALKLCASQGSGGVCSGSNSSKAMSEGASLDVAKLGQVERLVLELKQASQPELATAPIQAPAVPQEGAEPPAQCGSCTPDNSSDNITSVTQPNVANQCLTTNRQLQAASVKDAPVRPSAAGRGPKLPAISSNKGAVQKQYQQQRLGGPAGQLAGLLEADDAACVYFRECGGVAAAAQLVVTASVQARCLFVVVVVVVLCCVCPVVATWSAVHIVEVCCRFKLIGDQHVIPPLLLKLMCLLSRLVN